MTNKTQTNIIDIEMASKFAKISSAINKNREVYIPPTLYVYGKIIPTNWWARHFDFEPTTRLNYWKLKEGTSNKGQN